VEKIIKVAIFIKVVNGLLTIETRVWVAIGISILGLTKVEKIDKVVVSIKVVDYLTIVERVVWVPTRIMQPMVLD
jgi:hypothetical protein